MYTVNHTLSTPVHPPPPLYPQVAFTCGDQCKFELGNIDGTKYNGTDFNYTLEKPLDPEIQVLLRRAYYASTSFMDAQVGRMRVATADTSAAAADASTCTAGGTRVRRTGRDGRSGEYPRDLPCRPRVAGAVR
jgi:hypothetical protein